MNRLLVWLFILLLPAIGCKKSTNDNCFAANASLIGKWVYTDYYYSIGGPGKWELVKPANQVIEFKTDGSFQPSESFLKGVTNYEILDSTTVKFMPVSLPSGYLLMGYNIKSENGNATLFLYPVNPRCIEDCNNKFRRYTVE